MAVAMATVMAAAAVAAEAAEAAAPTVPAPTVGWARGWRIVVLLADL